MPHAAYEEYAASPSLQIGHPNLTFAIGRVVMANALCFQRAEAQGLHYIFIGGKDSLGSAAMRGGGWFGSVSLS